MKTEREVRAAEDALEESKDLIAGVRRVSVYTAYIEMQLQVLRWVLDAEPADGRPEFSELLVRIAHERATHRGGSDAPPKGVG